MPPTNSRFRSSLSTCAAILLWTALFAVAYAQSPLYTSNQNQYFLHGLAQAGYGYLHQDWLANTLDPTPVFSALVDLTYRYFQNPSIFYVFYAVLMGVYLFSLYGIAGKTFGIGSSPVSSLLFLSLLILIHAAGLRFALSRFIGVNWTYILEDGLADQRMLGPVFQPSAFGVLLVLSIYLFLRGRQVLAGLCAALAAIIHPTYLLASGMLTASYMLITLWETRQLKQPILIGLGALLPILPLLGYIWSSFGGQVSEITLQARQILVEYRIPHHALAAQWLDATAWVKIGLVTLCLILVRRERIFWILLLPFLAASLLTLLQIITQSYSLALLFPWRISVLLVPLSTALLLAFLVTRALELPAMQSPGWQKGITIASLLVVILCVLVGGIRFYLDRQRKLQEAERKVLAYIYAHKLPHETYLTPVKMQDFRLFTGAPIYIDFKSIPYKDSDVIEWYRRIQLAERFYETKDCQVLQDISDEGVTHIVLSGTDLPLACPLIEETYRDPDFTVFKLLPDP
jgi:hypothetical protein